MTRLRTGAALIGAAVALIVGGSVASAGPDPSVPEPSVPETSEPPVTIPVETSVPSTESSAPSESDTYTLTIVLPDAWPDPGDVSVRIASADDVGHSVDPEQCVALPLCATFDVAPGRYELLFEITDPPQVASFLILGGEAGLWFEVEIVDADVELRFDMGATLAPPLPPSTSTTTSTVAAAGPVPVTELPQTGSNGRLGVASLVLIGVGLGCVVAARRRPA